MTWDVIKEALFPTSEGSVTLALAYWSVLAGFVGLELFAPQFRVQQRAQRWPANFGLGLINMTLVPLAPISGLIAAEWARRNGIGVLNWLNELVVLRSDCYDCDPKFRCLCDPSFVSQVIMALAHSPRTPF